jgi:uncharacterized Fe-S cluster-containing radical SAM superfamily protein
MFDPRPATHPLPGRKFADPDVTATGERRASVRLGLLKTLWFNTGTLCNIACANCYIESGPTNDRLAYLTLRDVESYLDEIACEHLPVEEIGFTGGEPFMNRALPGMIAACLDRGFRVLVLTNAMKPMQNRAADLLALRSTALTLRVSLDHYTREGHERLRGAGSWQPGLTGFRWLAANGFQLRAAARVTSDEGEASLRAGFAELFANEGIPIDAGDPKQLVLFPEMDLARDVPEITTRCWDILGISPDAMMCASSRMVVKRRGAAAPVVVPCTLLPYDAGCELGASLAAAAAVTVKLNHPFCAQFCVLGGARCS